MEDYLKIEHIRLVKAEINQTDFAKLIGTTYRTYQGRLNGTQPEWKLEEVIKASKLNGGKILINSFGKDYKILIKEVVD